MPVSMSPQAVTPSLWTYTYLQAPINGQGFTYFNIPVEFQDKGTVNAGGTVACNIAEAGVFKVIANGNLTVSFNNYPSTSKGAFWQLEIKAGGSYTITWPGNL